MKKDIKKINITINGEEENRSEIIYNNVISNLGLSEEEQIKYLKNRAAILELEMKNKNLTMLLCLISVVGILFGITLLVNDLYLLGSIFIVVTFIGVITRFYLMYKVMIDRTRNKEFERIEQIKNILEQRIK